MGFKEANLYSFILLLWGWGALYQYPDPETQQSYFPENPSLVGSDLALPVSPNAVLV